jgi:mono/diheme cytochrome c family protein
MMQTGGRGRPAALGAALVCYLAAGAVAGAREGPAAADLKRGLVTTYRDAAKPTPAEAVRLEPTVALALKAGEAPDWRLQGDGGTAVWQGYLNVLRGGKYRFQVRLRGRFRLQIAGQEVLAAEVKDAQAARKEGPEVRLEAGVHPLKAELTRPPGAAVVELLWKPPQVRLEPLPYDILGHLPTQAPAALALEEQAERGRFLAEEANCVRCHQPGGRERMTKHLVPHMGPDLSKAGERLHGGWVERWLESPRKLRPGAVMPEMFGHDETGRAERYAVARYLASLGGPLRSDLRPQERREMRTRQASGERLFNSVGCLACHGPATAGVSKPKEDARQTGLYRRPALYALSSMGSKTTPDRLRLYLQNPLAIDPSGRMPRLPLDGREAQDLAYFLCQSTEEGLNTDLLPAPPKEQMLAAFRRADSRAEELAAFEKLPAERQWEDLGKRVVIDKGCNNCHVIAPGGKSFANMQAGATLDDVIKSTKEDKGCLASDPARRGKAPGFGFGKEEREALRVFLVRGLSGAGTHAPALAARRDLQRFNCLACHGRDGEGGLGSEVTEQLRRNENAENAEAVVPPVLTGVGHKLRTPWLHNVLVGGGRARPWMALRMPQFGDANVGRLPDALAALEGAEPDESVHKVPLTATKLDTGRHLVGKNAFGCISCHDIAGVPNTGTRGPDLAGMNQRVRYEWYLRWLEQPQRIQPGTRMPSVFMDGKSLLDKVLDGKADTQAEAMWAYLSLGNSLPLPAGLEPRKGLALPVTNRPVLLRTFMPDAGSRAVAVGFPGGVSVAFDAHSCRLAYAWSGEFLDASPAWNDRGGNPAKVLGARFWQAPPGCPVATNTSGEPPDFAARAKDPAHGAHLPNGKIYQGPALLKFTGYATDKAGVPTFRYSLQPDTPDKVTVSERLGPLRSSVAVGVARRFRLELPAQQTAWLLAAEAAREPRLLDDKGAPLPLDLKPGRAEVDPAGRLLVLPQREDRVAVLALTAAPAGSRWHLQRVGGAWQAVLRVPPAAVATKPEVGINVWVPYRDEPGLLKELVTQKK